MHKYTLMISEPVEYRKNTIRGVLNHEIGTHFIRKYNEQFQKWYHCRKKYNISPDYLHT